MNKRKKFSDRLLNNLKLLLVISQFLGVIGAVMIGGTLGDGFSGYLFGYVLGSLLGLGFSLGLS